MAEQQDNFKYFIRIASTDLDGSKPIEYALTKIKGIGNRYAHAICVLSGIDRTTKAGTLSDKDVEKLDGIIADPSSVSMPEWLLNRRKDYEDGSDKHLITGDLKFQLENDIKRLKKIKSYRGVRHGVGLPLRGQRTKSNFRRNKGRGSLGVKKKK